jgi:hypothetical protein
LKKRVFQNRGILFEPTIRRESGFVADINFSNYLYRSNNELIHESKRGKSLSEGASPESKTGKIFSTNEYNIDFSKFENHTFFDSAISKTNIGFDRIVNNYPFDGSRQDTKDFRSNSTGFETYVFDNFPNNRGYLIFRPDGSTSQHISVKDLQGYLYSSDNTKKTNNPVFSPNKSGFTVEFWVRIPPHSNNKQVLCQLIDTSRSGLSLTIDNDSGTANCNLNFSLLSGSNYETIESSISKGTFVHVAAVYNNKKKYTSLFIDGDLKVTSSIRNFNNLEMRQSDFLIGSGSAYNEDLTTVFTPVETFSGSMDEFRFYHGSKTHKQINRSLRSSIYKDDEENLDLKLYFKFNEPEGTYSGNNLVLDYSGNSLHSLVSGHTSAMRITGSADKLPLTQEISKESVVLFPDYTPVKNFNASLLTSASNYDDINPNIITKLIPVHYLLEGQVNEGMSNLTGSMASVIKGGNLPDTGQIGNSQLIISFLLIWAKFFDELKINIDNFSNILSLSYDSYEGSSTPFYRLAAEHRGIKLPQIINRDVDYLKFAEGLNLSSLDSLSKLSLNQVQNEIWKRLLLNIKQIHKEKGTKRSIKSLFNSFGLEFNKYFDLKEYGGPRAHYLSDLRKFDKKVIRYIDFSGSAASRTAADQLDINAQGFSAGTAGRKAAPYLVSPFLSGSRLEVGYPSLPVGAQATGTVECLETNPSLYNNDTVKITDTDGTTIIYKFVTATTATGTIDGSDGEGNRIVIVSLHGLAASVSAYALELRDAINHANGHNGTIGIVQSSGELTLTQQLRDGLGTGNEAIVFTQPGGGGSTPVSVSGFSGGTGVFFKRSTVHGESANPNDGLFTSGSFTYEGVYKFTDNVKHHVTQSLVRLVTTGTSLPASTTGGLLANLIAINDKENTKLKLYARPFDATSSEKDVLETQIVSASIFDGKPWYISFGRVRNDDTIFYELEDIKNTPSSSYFLRCGRVGERKARTYFATSSFLGKGTTAMFNARNDAINSSGSFLVIGSQSINAAGTTRYLNSPSIVDEARESNFSGKVNFIRFYSRALTDREARERVKNPFSLGVKNPLANFNHDTEFTGAFNRTRLDATISRQTTTGSDVNGSIRFFDNSQNGFHLIGSMFEPDKKILKSDQINFSRISHDFDERVTEDRVRVRSYELKNNLEESLYARQAPVYEIQEGDKSDDDKRLSIDLSSVRSLNEDIIKMIDSLEVFDEAIGDPRLMFEDEYLELEKLREVYFQELLQKVDLESHVRFFTWFDNSFTDLIKTLIPLEAVFLGVNYVIEPHILERSRLRYYFNQQYLSPDSTAFDSTSIRGGGSSTAGVISIIGN